MANPAVDAQLRHIDDLLQQAQDEFDAVPGVDDESKFKFAVHSGKALVVVWDLEKRLNTNPAAAPSLADAATP